MKRRAESSRSDRPGGRGGSRERGAKGPGGRGGRDGDRPRIFRKKVCRFCTERVPVVDYKETELIQKFLTEKGKIIPRRITGNCSKHQRALARAIKRTRHSALIAFQAE